MKSGKRISRKCLLVNKSIPTSSKSRNANEKRAKNKDYDLLKSVSKVIDAVRLLSSDDVLSKISEARNFFRVTINIDGVIDSKFNSTAFAFLNYTEAPGIILFKSLSKESNLNKLFWKQSGPSDFYVLEIPNDILIDYIRNYIELRLKLGFNGILRNSSNSKKITLDQIGDDKGQNLLIHAVNKKDSKIIEALLEFDFDVNYENDESFCAIDHAWETYLDDTKMSQDDEIILILLNANSRLPKSFEFEKASEGVQSFIKQCETLHELVGNNNLKYIKELIKGNLSNLTFFYDRNNESLLTRAIKLKKKKICSYLMSMGLSVGCHENIELLYETLQRDNAELETESHILVLVSKSKIANNDRNFHKRWTNIKEAFEIINEDKICSNILKLVAEYKKLIILFDFMHDTTVYLNPISQNYCGADRNQIGKIFVGAKNLLDEKRKYEVCGMMAHEFSHLAIEMGFCNNFNPYPCGESVEKENYSEICKTFFEDKNDETDEIISRVFNFYNQDFHHSELIVRIPQILTAYFKERERIKKLYEKYKKLFIFHENYVEPEMMKALIVQRILSDETYAINFRNLTEPYKAKILHSEIVKFHGKQSSLFKIVGNDEEILRKLTSSEIRSIFQNDEFILEIGSAFGNDSSQITIERNFEKNSLTLVEGEKSKMNFDDIRIEADSSKCIILCDSAASGKTTTFCEFARKFQEFCTENFWISYINSKKSEQILQKYSSQKTEPNCDKNLLDFMCTYENFKSPLEESIFKKYYNSDKVIFLIDAFDEIQPDHSEIMIEMLKKLRFTTQNQLWISTRPHCGQQLEKSLNAVSYKFSKLSSKEYKNYILEKLEKNKIDDEELQQKALNEIENFIDEMDIADSFGMVDMITENYVNQNMSAGTLNPYEIYKKIWEENFKKIVDKKIKKKEDEFSVEPNFLETHQALAMKFIFGDEVDLKIHELSITELGNKMKQQNWLNGALEECGIVTINISDQFDNFHFIHKTFAEYFVADYIMAIIFSGNRNKPKDNEMEIFFNFVNFIASGRHKHKNIQKFIFNYKTEERSFTEFFRQYFIENVDKIHQKILCSSNEIESLEIIKFWSKLLANDAELKRCFCKNDEILNFYARILQNLNLDPAGYEEIQKFFGSNVKGSYKRKKSTE